MMMMLMMMMAKVDDNDGQWWLASSGRWAGAEQQIALDGKTDENTIKARTQNELKKLWWALWHVLSNVQILNVGIFRKWPFGEDIMLHAPKNKKLLLAFAKISHHFFVETVWLPYRLHVAIPGVTLREKYLESGCMQG